MDKIKILVCCHKPTTFYQDEVYTPIQAGKAISNIDLGILGDDTGDNISAKNKRYCETTVLYWAWKNLKDVEYIGFNHYRRKFKFKITPNNIDKLMKGKDIIVVNNGKQRCSVIDLLRPITCLEDEYIFVDTILELYPDYRDSIIEYYFTNNRFIPNQIFVTRRNEFEKYAQFLFSILFRFEEKIRPAQYTRLNRSIAYMGEFLLGLYCLHNKLKIRFLELDSVRYPKYKRILRNIRNEIIFSMLPHPHKLPASYGFIPELKEDNIFLQHINETA